MNALIALCHFCEVHGPCAVFCTQTLRDTRINELVFSSDVVNNNCAVCNSIGNIGMLSQDVENNVNFMSTQIPVIPETVSLVKQAAVRSLSCEISFNKNGFVFFGDSARGHILSHTFQLNDSQARGFFRLFSIVIIMKDKLFLLNVQPFLAEHLENISKELQNYSTSIYNLEQSKCSERAQRLNAGQANTQAPRSLAELTGEPHIFAQLHSHFAWLLWAGARYLTETVTLGSATVPPWLGKETEEGFTMVQMDKEEWILKKLGIDTTEDDEYLVTNTIRSLIRNIRSDFITTCYCAMVGIQIILRGPEIKTYAFIKCLRKLLPESLHKLTKINGTQYLPSTEYRILSVPTEVAVPQPCIGIFRIDFTDDDKINVKWLGELPNKLPNFLTKVIKAIDEQLLTDMVLDKHLKVLVEEWKNKVLCIKKIHSNQELGKIRNVLGIQQQDNLLINYWSNYM